MTIGKRGDQRCKAEGLEKIIFDLPQRVNNCIGNSLQTILIRNTTDNWDEMYGRLLNFGDKEGHAKPRIDHPELGIWTDSQRQNYRKNRLPKKRVELLEKLIPKGWVWNNNEGRQSAGWIITYFRQEWASQHSRQRQRSRHCRKDAWAGVFR